MITASTRLRRLALVSCTLALAYLASPLTGVVPLLTVAAAESDGLGAGGAAAAYNFVLAVAIILAFIFGFAIRDVIHRHAIRAKAKGIPKPSPKRT